MCRILLVDQGKDAEQLHYELLLRRFNVRLAQSMYDVRCVCESFAPDIVLLGQLPLGIAENDAARELAGKLPGATVISLHSHEETQPPSSAVDSGPPSSFEAMLLLISREIVAVRAKQLPDGFPTSPGDRDLGTRPI